MKPTEIYGKYMKLVNGGPAQTQLLLIYQTYRNIR